jgi:GTP-binding protein Era
VTQTAEPRTACGIVAVVGAPNAGKSTLVNALVGAKVSIVSPKVQTTRARVMGVAMVGATQVVLVDTPGIFTRPRRRLERAMVKTAWRETGDADEIAVLVDASRKGDDSDTAAILEGLRGAGRHATLVLNKIDLVKRPLLLGLAQRLNASGMFDHTYMVSALTGDGVDDLKRDLAARMPEGAWLYPPDQLSDMPERLLAAEIVREKLFLQLHKELPYALTVETEGWKRFRDGSVKVELVIYVERDSQKGIVLGKGGARVKAVGAAAREELQALLDRRVHLYLFVKVREKWAEDPERYREMGLDFDA